MGVNTDRFKNNFQIHLDYEVTENKLIESLNGNDILFMKQLTKYFSKI